VSPACCQHLLTNRAAYSKSSLTHFKPFKMPEALTQRIVPGAPPPAPLTKSQKKKRKAKKPTESTPDSPVAIPDAISAALVEEAPDAADVREGSVAPELVAQVEPQTPILPEEEMLLKPSPIVELIHKRLKATTKKIVRYISHP